MAVRGMLTALCVVLMMLGSLTGVMTYICPLLAGLPVLLVREKYGRTYALTLWIAAGLLGLLLVPEKEMALLFLGLFGWYPAVKPSLDRQTRWLRWGMKLLLCSLAFGVIYGAGLYLLGVTVEETGGMSYWLLVLGMSDLIFLLYDVLLSQKDHPVLNRLRRLLP